MNKIYCFGDGYAANHIWPEWPAIVAALYPEIECQNFGKIGAGNEYISSAVIQAYRTNPDAFFLIQWARPCRFDKLLEDGTWDNIIDADPIYYFNRVKLVDQTWWLSSASTQPDIQQYHNHFIQPAQANLRSFNYIYLIQKLLTDHAIHFSTYTLPVELTIQLSMCDYSNQERFNTVRSTEPQPSPPVHMAWVDEYILPNLPVKPDAKRLTELKRRITARQWQPFDSDRVESWQKLIDF